MNTGFKSISMYLGLTSRHSQFLKILSIVVPAVAGPSTAIAQSTERKAGVIEEILVTANKRSQSISDIAGAVSAIDKKMLEETGAVDLSEYLTLSPGVNFSSGTPGLSVITIRGVSSDTIPSQAQTAVGVYFDDIPLTDPSAPMVVPDIDSFDAQRVEILRGPQGALYGSASMGGAVNYIPQAPDASGLDLAAQLTASRSTNSSLGGSGKLMLNLPLVDDVLALRASAHRTQAPGYIDNVGTGTDESNEVVTQGGRASLAWALNDISTLRLTGLYQETEVADAPYIDERLGDLKKETIVSEPTDNMIKLGGLRYELMLDTYGELIFIGSVQEKSSFMSMDGASALGTQDTGERILLQQGGGVEGYSAELRFVSEPGEWFEYLVGASYANREENFFVILDSATLDQSATSIGTLLTLPSTISGATTVFRESVKIDAPEKALFFEGTWRFFHDFNLTAGGRYYDNRVDSVIDGRGLLFLTDGGTEFHETRRSGATGFNPKVSLGWEASDDILVYGLYSRGYRLGGPNLTPNNAIFTTKTNYNPDEVKNFELGVKTAWLDRRLTLDLAAFYIDWQDMQLVAVDDKGTFKFLDNAGDAVIQGVEMSLDLIPLEFLSLRTAVTWLDARLAEDYDPQNGRPPSFEGDRLPGSPEWSASNTLRASWEHLSLQPSVTLIHRYEGESSTSLSFQDVKKGDYHLLDLRLGMKLGALDITAFCKNISDERGVTAANNYAGSDGSVLSLKYITPPRNLGVQLNYRFQP